jgi:enoyl-CoA hydratase/carnithine racemase
MSEGTVSYRRDGLVGWIVFERPQARNAMTWAMYEQLGEACSKASADPGLRTVVFRGAGGKAFVAGTDIAQFSSFQSAADGIDYERRMEPYLSAVEALPMPTLAVIEGWAIGGGLAIAAACDLRIATPGTRFGVPIARTLGNCLSVANYARLVAALGVSRAKKMLLMAENLTAEEALDAGFLAEIVSLDGLDARISAYTDRLSSGAPITLRVTKEAIRRLLHAGMPDGDDLIAQAYGSADFQVGVAAFLAKQEPRWTGS